MGGQKKRPFFQNPKKWGISKKKKMGAKWGGEKNRPFLKNGDAKIKKKWKNALWAQKNTDFCFPKKKKDGEKMGAS